MKRSIFTAGALAGAALAAACTGTEDPSAAGGDASSPPEAQSELPSPEPSALEDIIVEFDRDRSRAEADALLGLPEAEVEPSQRLRIVRRGDERFPVTMDLRPGRLNVEFDERGGVHVVTRVVVETPEGSMIVE